MESRAKILIVDDDELSQDIFKIMLSKKYDIFTATGVNSFYSIINKVKFNLIIMDISLKDYKDGIELTGELKASSKYCEIPVIILTAFNTTKEKRAAVDSGAEYFLTKPADPLSMVNIIESTLLKKSKN